MNIKDDNENFSQFDKSATIDIENITSEKVQFEFSDYFDLSEMQRIQDSFSSATGVASIITKVDGTPITKPSNFCSFCNEIVRKTESGMKNCMKFNSIIGSPKKDGPRIQRCLSSGLMNGGTSIIVGDKHIANWLIGQVIDEEYKVEDLLAYADVIGVNRDVYKSELHKVTHMSKLQFETICNFLYLNAQQLSNYAMKNILLTQEINKKTTNEKEISYLYSELDKQKKFLQQMLNVIPDLIFYKDKYSVYLGGNKAFAENFIGLSEKEIVGKTDFDFFKDEMLASFFRQKDKEVLETGKTKTNEETIALADGRVIEIETVKSPFFDENGKVAGLIGISRDITERTRFEQELLKAKESAEAATIAKSQFLANMSHEIRTPMNGIIGMTDLTLMTKLTEEQREYLTVVKSSTSLLLKILNDILDYSKIEAGKIDLERVPFNIRETTNEVVDLFTIIAKQKNIYIKLTVDKKVPEFIIGDSVRLKQVLSNLMGNSIKFTSSGGVTVTIDIVELGERCIKLSFVVSDTGIGICEDKLGKLFKRFSQVDDSSTRQYGGTGLGLAISKKLVEMMGGNIGVESKEYIGSKFYFSANFGVQEDATITPNTAHRDKIQIKNREVKKVLFVEDDKVSRSFGVIVLEKMGLDVITAENGKEAIEKFEKDTFDLILMDVNLPLIDGFTATAVIRVKEKKRTPIIAMTAYALSGDREKCIDAGMDDYISKPIDINEMTKKVNFWLTKGK